MTSFIENNLSDEIQGLLFRISTGEFGPVDSLSDCCEYLTHALSVANICEAQNSINNDHERIDNIESSGSSKSNDDLEILDINNWICVFCTFENNISSDICEMCLKSNVDISDNESKNIDTDISWKCKHCTFINNSTSTICSICSKTNNDIQTNLTGFDVNNDLENVF